MRGFSRDELISEVWFFIRYPVLFVDDEPNVLRAYSRNLRREFDVTSALSGAEALALMEAAEIDFAVVVSDMQMPGMNGVEFLRQAKGLRPDTVRMMLTGNADQHTAKVTLETF